MKKIMSLLAFMVVAITCFSQTTILAPGPLTAAGGTVSFYIDQKLYPFNTVVLNVRPDTLNVELDFAITGTVIVKAKPVSAYTREDGTPFANAYAIKQFYDSFMVTVATGGGGGGGGDASAANQVTEIARLTSINGKLPAALGAQTTSASMSVNVASDQVVPVSASALPLPTGAATAANQSTTNSTLSTINGKLPAQGAAATSASIPVNIANDQTVPVSAASLPLPSGAATSANQTTGNSSLSSIDGKIPAKGSTTMANSTPVTIATDQGNINVSVQGTANVTPVATENHLGQIGGSTAQIASTPTISTSAYSAGDVVGGKITLTSAMRITNGTATIASVIIIDKANQKAALDILIFGTDPSNGTYTDNAAFTANATDMGYLIRKISIAAADYTTYGTYAVADPGTIAKAITGNASNANLYMVIVTSGTPTYASTSDLTIKTGFYRD